MRVQKSKIFLLVLIVIAYIVFGMTVFYLRSSGVIASMEVKNTIEIYKVNLTEQEVEQSYTLATEFFNTHMKKPEGYVSLYYGDDSKTNSEAVSYYLYWNAVQGNKEEFDLTFNFIESKMLHPEVGYIMWQITPSGEIIEDGDNIASDADLRTLKALFIAEQKWGDIKYSMFIDKFSTALENVVVTDDGYFVPYGGYDTEMNATWKAEEVWLSYSDFATFKKLEERKGKTWGNVYNVMKKTTLEAQTEKGFYNTELNDIHVYDNELDAGQYSLNSLWIMVRAAESGDGELMASANKSLQFYKWALIRDDEVYSAYNVNGDSASIGEEAWSYALLARAAIALGDKDLADAFMQRLLSYQEKDETSAFYGAFTEGGMNKKAGQFTNQEAIITLQAYLNKKW